MFQEVSAGGCVGSFSELFYKKKKKKIQKNPATWSKNYSL